VTRPAALVTGGASGIGRATVDTLLARGWAVVAADFNADAGAALPSGPSLAFIRADVTREEDVRAAVDHVVATFGWLDCVVNNAGIGGAFGQVTELEAADWDATFAVLVRAVFFGIKHAARVLQAQGEGGAIVNTASIAGHVGGRRDLAAAMEGVQPWPDIGAPADIANVIAFLASPEARFVTGQDVIADGGLVASGIRLGDAIGGDPAARGLVGINRGSTGAGHTVRSRPPR
jgi:NAD(P)-dependent dehydrogenase (short-subunit alcohol dehydrogenase family)